MFCDDFLGLGENMGNAGLPVRPDAVIGGISVADQGSGKVLSEDGFRHVGRPMPVNMEEGEEFITGKPNKMAQAVTSPRGFIGMDHIGDSDFIAQILIDRHAAYRRFPVERQGGSRDKLQPKQRNRSGR